MFKRRKKKREVRIVIPPLCRIPSTIPSLIYLYDVASVPDPNLSPTDPSTAPTSIPQGSSVSQIQSSEPNSTLRPSSPSSATLSSSASATTAQSSISTPHNEGGSGCLGHVSGPFEGLRPNTFHDQGMHAQVHIVQMMGMQSELEHKARLASQVWPRHFRRDCAPRLCLACIGKNSKATFRSRNLL